MAGSLSLGLFLGAANLSQGGPAQFIVINGQRGQLLLGKDGKYLTGADGAPLYGKAA